MEFYKCIVKERYDNWFFQFLLQGGKAEDWEYPDWLDEDIMSIDDIPDIEDSEIFNIGKVKGTRGDLENIDSLFNQAMKENGNRN